MQRIQNTIIKQTKNQMLLSITQNIAITISIENCELFLQPFVFTNDQTPNFFDLDSILYL